MQPKTLGQISISTPCQYSISINKCDAKTKINVAHPGIHAPPHFSSEKEADRKKFEQKPHSSAQTGQALPQQNRPPQSKIKLSTIFSMFR